MEEESGYGKPPKSKQFSKDNQPKGRKSRKGIPNRATALKRFLATASQFDSPDPEQSDKIKGTLEEAIAAAQIKRALTGDTLAFREIMDSVYGKIPQKNEVEGSFDIVWHEVKNYGSPTKADDSD